MGSGLLLEFEASTVPSLLVASNVRRCKGFPTRLADEFEISKCIELRSVLLLRLRARLVQTPQGFAHQIFGKRSLERCLDILLQMRRVAGSDDRGVEVGVCKREAQHELHALHPAQQVVESCAFPKISYEGFPLQSRKSFALPQKVLSFFCMST